MRECIIIGAGIAGLTAALYAQRKRMDFLLISEDFGGQLNLSGEIENYPGIVKTDGQEFEKVLKEQMDYNKVEMKEEKVTGIENSGNNFRVKTEKSDYKARSVIIASGARARKLNVPGEKEFANKGLTYCAICDGPLFPDKEVAIIGGGNAAFEAADFMLNIAKRIHLIDAADQPIAHEYLQERIKDHDKVEYINKAKVKEIYGDKMAGGIRYEREGKEHKLDVGGVIIEIGRIPNTEPFKGLVEINDSGHIIIGCDTKTSQEGIFAAGDCASGEEYQYVIAAGQGCMALLKAARYLAGKKEG
ncbi:MAG: NAD(P)/FAD-dependent oxidoreductase [Candidatus Woesearchaeota archaeon]